MQDDNDNDIYDFANEWDDLTFSYNVPRDVRVVRFNPTMTVLPIGCCRELEWLEEVILPPGLWRISNAAFGWCEELTRITVPATTGEIGEESFACCYKLPKDFVQNLPFGLETIDDHAFNVCVSLEGFTIPPTVDFLGISAFADSGLIEVNLATKETALQVIPRQAFCSCERLQSVALSNSLKRIGEGAFEQCASLISVVIPPDSSFIVEGRAFASCKNLCCIQLAGEDSFAENAFEGCSPRLIENVVHRFDSHQIHKLCYYASTITEEELRQSIVNHQSLTNLQDQFGMTPFHVLLSSPTPRQDLFLVLLEYYPPSLLAIESPWFFGGKQPIHFLWPRWGLLPPALRQTVVRAWLVGPMERRQNYDRSYSQLGWGLPSWKQDMQARADAIAAEPDRDLLDETLDVLQNYEKREAMSVLERAVWKARLLSNLRLNRFNDQIVLNPNQAFQHCGADIVLKCVNPFITPFWD